MLFSAIMIQQLGRIEMHFHVFVSYPSWLYGPIPVMTAATDCLHHLIETIVSRQD